MNLSVKSSNVINALKCVLCVGVVIVHGQMNVNSSQLLGDVVWRGLDYQYFSMFQYVFAKCFLDKVCVPVFFVISGFLFFLKSPECVEWKWFGKKYKSRAKSLLIPYIIANAVFIVSLTALHVYRGNTDISFLSVIRGFWDNGSSFPADPPLWFMRDLLVVVVFSPVVFWAIKKFSAFFPILLGVLYVSAWPTIPFVGVNARAFFFFSVGAYFSIKNIDFVEKIHTDYRLIIYWILYVAILGMYLYLDKGWILRLSVVFAIVPMVATVKKFVRDDKPIQHKYVVSTVFIYMYHYYVAVVAWRVFAIMTGVSEVALFVNFFAGAITTVVGMLFLYLMLSKFFPKFTSVIVGGR